MPSATASEADSDTKDHFTITRMLTKEEESQINAAAIIKAQDDQQKKESERLAAEAL